MPTEEKAGSADMGREQGQNQETVTILSDLSNFMRQLDEIDEAEVHVKRTASSQSAPSQPTTGAKRTRSADCVPTGDDQPPQPQPPSCRMPNPPKRRRHTTVVATCSYHGTDCRLA